MGTDANGPNKAYLVLKADNGSIRQFFIGGYATVEECLGQLKYETDSAAQRSHQFWTNADFSYGGVEEPG